jgi:tRNA A-37 threonylcarbamoyl transferase component Bud32
MAQMDPPHRPGGLREAASSSPADDPIRPEVERALAGAGPGWSMSTFPEDPAVWISFEHRYSRPPARGWKLHVSATIASSVEVLRRALVVLLGDSAGFKVAASLPVLMTLNEGEAGVSQIGKFITVYPDDADNAVRLARELREATRGMPGPPVPSDRSLEPEAIVFYRYGDLYDPDEMETEHGTVEPGEGSPQEDPFVTAGLAKGADPLLVGGRYLVTTTLHRSARGTVHVGLDLENSVDCVLKRAWRHARATPDGRDARDHLRAEAHVLEELGTAPFFPPVMDVVEHNGDLVMVLGYVEGLPVSRVVKRRADPGHIPATDIASWGAAIAEALQHVHMAGFVYGDVNPENVILRRRGGVCLIDFELTRRPGETNPYFAAGTPGFVSPEQARGEPADPADDVYGLGALLAFMATGEPPDPSREHEPGSTVDPVLGTLIRQCLADDRKARPNIASVRTRLEEIAHGETVVSPEGNF